MWVARDKTSFSIHELNLYAEKPWRSKQNWVCRCSTFQLPKELFPDIKWENEPLEVELTSMSQEKK